MFGLDARIALAIFAALSVITGAALYSSIKQARLTAFVTELNEIGKAWEAYMLDTGTNLPKQTSGNSLKASELVESTKPGWKGPYLSYSIDGTFPQCLKHHTYGFMFMIPTRDIDWGQGTIGWSGAPCLNNNDCYLWIHIADVTNSQLKFDLDELIDKSDGASKGNFRWAIAGDAYDDRIYYRYIKIRKPF